MKHLSLLITLLILTINSNAQFSSVKLTSISIDLQNNRGWSSPKDCNYNLYIGEKITFIKGDGEHVFTVHSKNETYEKEKYNVFNIVASSSQDGECKFKFIFGKYDRALIIEYKNKPREMYQFDVIK
jgi:hypothetical protein